MDWDRVEVQVSRLSSTTNLNRKQFQAIQVKTLKKELSEERLKDLLSKRTQQGLTYRDEDYPEDPDEMWVYMPSGRLLRTDDITAEEMKTTAHKTGGRNLLDAMTGEEGPLSAGACPIIKGISEAGQKLMWKAMDEEGKEVAKRPKVPKKKETETVVPKTILQWGSQVSFRQFSLVSVYPRQHAWLSKFLGLAEASFSALRAGKDRLPSLLADASSARTKSIRLRGVEFAQDLAEGLLKFATAREAEFGALQKLVAACNEREIGKFLQNLEESEQWFVNAEVRVSYFFHYI